MVFAPARAAASASTPASPIVYQLSGNFTVLAPNFCQLSVNLMVLSIVASASTPASQAPHTCAN